MQFEGPKSQKKFQKGQNWTGESNFARFERKNTNRVFVGVIFPPPNSVDKKTLRGWFTEFFMACEPSH